MYIVEWYDREGELHQMAFDSRERADREAAHLEKEYDHAAVVWEVDI